MGVLAARRGALVVASAAVLAVIAAPRAARAWTLDYDVDGECADAEAFRARVETQRLRDGDVDRVAVRVTVAAVAGDRWHARVEITAADPEATARELAGTSCAEVHDAAILIVAQLLDGVARPVVVRAVAPRRFTRVPGVDDAVPPRPPDPPVSIRIRGALGADVGSLPSPSPGARASLDFAWRRAVVTLGATAWREVTELDEEGQGLTVSAWQAVAAARFRVTERIDLGAQLEIGELAARGRGVATELQQDGAWQAVGPAARARVWAWRGLEITLEIEVLFPIGTTTFVVDGEPRYRSGPTFRSFLGVGWQLLGGSSDGNRRGRP